MMRRGNRRGRNRRGRKNDGEADGERFQPQRPILPGVPSGSSVTEAALRSANPLPAAP
jgi:hypothetical protein